MKRASFTIHGKPVGYYSTTHKGVWTDPRVKKYHAWRDEVRRAASKAGITLPLVATEMHPLIILTVATFANRVHPDPENVHKGIVDALFYMSKAERAIFKKSSSDKHVGGAFSPPAYGDPGVSVAIYEDRQKGRK